MSEQEPVQLDQRALEYVLAELQRQHEKHLNALEVLDGKAARLLTWASLAIWVAAAVSMPELASSGNRVPPIVPGIALSLYLALVVLCLSAAFPRDYELPLPLERETLYEKFLKDGAYNALEQIVIQYLGTIARNSGKELRRSRLIRWGFFVLPPLIAASLAMMTWPLWKVYFG